MVGNKNPHHDQHAGLMAALILVGSMFIMSLQDMLMKLLSDQMSLWQFVALRAAAALPLIGLFAVWRCDLERIRPKNLQGLLIRTGLMMLALSCFFTSLSVLNMAQAAGGLYTAPLFIAILAHVISDERVGPKRVVAILAGFAGSMMILRPEFSDGGLISFLPIAAGAFYAMALIATRRLCAMEDPVTITIFNQSAYGIAGITGLIILTLIEPSPSLRAAVPFFFSGWQGLTLSALLIIAIIGLLNVIGHTGLSHAYQTAESSFLAPFDYSYLIFACIWSVVIWGEQLIMLDYLGVILIAGSGIFISWRTDKRQAVPG